MRRLGMTTAAVAIATLGFSNAPAHADQNDIAKVIVGLAGVAALAAIINDREKNRAKVQITQKQHALTPKHHNRGQKDRRARHRGQNTDFNQCLRQRWTQAGWETFVSNRCVSRLQAQERRGRHWNQGRHARR